MHLHLHPPSSINQPLVISPPQQKKAPTFAAFDHGDHYHFVFSVKHTNNASRPLSTIHGYLQVPIGGTTEAHTTLQLVRFAKRFLSYLLRKGIRTFVKFGSRTLTILKPITEAFPHSTSQQDVTDGSLPCNQYIEENITSHHHTANSRNFSIDYISSLIQDNKITSYEEFQRTLPTPIKIQLLKELGYVEQNIIKTLIKIYNIDNLQHIRSQHYYSLTKESFRLSEVSQNNVSWLTSPFHGK
jgi:hypothetical protein